MAGSNGWPVMDSARWLDSHLKVVGAVPLVAQSYDLTSLIGTGPTGSVWRARHRTTGDQVAVKLLETALATDPETVSRFIRERHLLTAALEPTLGPVRELLIGDAELALVTD